MNRLRKMDKIGRILILRPGGMGDVILSTPAFAALRDRYPAAKITLLTSPIADGLFDGDPRLDEVISFPVESMRTAIESHLPELIELERVLRDRGFDLAVDLRGNSLTSRIALRSGARWRVGVHSLQRGFWFGFRYNVRAKPVSRSAHRTDLARATLAPLGIEPKGKPEIFVSHSDRAWADRFIAQAGAAGHPRMAVQPGASDPAKCWSVEHFYDLAARASDSGIKVIVLGTEGQPEAAKLLELGGGRFISAVGATNQRQLGALISRCDLFVGNDSGPMHLACAVGVPVVALFAATDPRRYGPVGNQHRVFQAGVSPLTIWKAAISTVETTRAESAIEPAV